MTVCIAYLGLVSLSGVGLTCLAGISLRLEERVAIGAVCGLVMTSSFAFLAFLVFGMSPWTPVAGLLCSLVFSSCGWRRRSVRLRSETESFVRRLTLPTARPASVRPLAFLTLASAAVSTRMLSLAFQTTSNGTLRSGHLAVWGDWSAHLAYASSFAFGDNRSLVLPVAAGERFRYHFLADFFSALLTTMGVSVQQGLVLGSAVLAFVFPVLLYCAIVRLSGSRSVALVGSLLFTLNGGIGFTTFVTDLRTSGWRLFTAIPRSYARMPERGIWYDNTISAQLYAQRSTQLGLSVALAATIVVVAARSKRATSGFVASGVLVGLTALGHGQTVMTAIGLGFIAMLADRGRRRLWVRFLVPSVVLSAPVIWWLVPERSHLRWLVGWMAQSEHRPWVWFWLLNLGLFLPLAVAAQIFPTGKSGRRSQRLCRPLWLWFLIPNLVVFHPWEWNNTKYFVFWQLGATWLVAEMLVRWWRWTPTRSVGSSNRRTIGELLATTARRIGTATVSGSLVFSGSLDLVRSMQPSSGIDWTDKSGAATALWIRENTLPNAVIVHAPENTSPMTALSGRKTVSGYPGWTWDLGLKDWAARQYDAKEILSGGPMALSVMEKYGVGYVVIGPKELANWAASLSYWRNHGRIVHEQGGYVVFEVADP